MMIPAYFFLFKMEMIFLTSTENYRIPYIRAPNLLLKFYQLKKWPSTLAYLRISNTETAFKQSSY